jgi:hypothetical protein
VKLAIKKGTTSKRVMVFIQDSASTTGAGKTGLTSASVTCYYWREDAGDVGATAVSLVAGTRGTWTSGGFVEKDATNMPGFYELGIPNAALATGADWVGMQIKGTGIAPLPIEIQLTDNTTKDVYDRIGAPAGASLAADVSTRAPEAAGNVAAIKAKTDQLTFTLANKVDSSIQAAGDFAQAAADKVWGSAARTLTGFGTLVADIWAYSTRTLSAFSTTLALSVWDVLESAIVTASSIGLKLKTNLDATISSRSTFAGGAVASVTADVGITQAGADKVWGSAARTLTSFGTLVADIWAYATRTLTGFGTLIADIWAYATRVATSVDALGTQAKADARAEVNAALDTVIPELSQAKPSATPTVRTALALLYMTLRNKFTQTATEAKVHNDAGTAIAKAAVSDDGTTFTRNEMESGP